VSGAGFITAWAMVIFGGLILLHAAHSLSEGVVDVDWGTIERAEKPLAFRLAIGFEAVLGLLFISCAAFNR
jgi:hypothetical protein